MTKEEKIKEEYLKLGLPFNENIIFDNGWLRIKPSLYSSKYDNLDLLKLTKHVHSIRPISLQGIENNNGWIKIETKEDLPEYGYYEVVVRSNEEIIRATLDENTPLFYYSHYQPILEIKPPLY